MRCEKTFQRKKPEQYESMVKFIQTVYKDNNKPTITLQIKAAFVAYHFWKKAPEEVKFLRNPHRHIFLVVSMIPVAGDDRELEFFIIQKDLRKYFKKNFEEKTFGYSCEQFATIIKKYIDKKYKVSSSVGVYEDGENGAIAS